MKATTSFLEVFFFVLGESYSILAVGLQCIMKNALSLPCYGLFITYLIILSLGKKYCFGKKSGSHSVRIKWAFTENVTDTIDFLDLLKSPLLLFFSGWREIHRSKILPVTS